MQRLVCHPLVTIRSNLGDIDRRWLELIEPFVYRPPKDNDAFGCWLWQGHIDHKTGEPFRNLYDPTKRRGEKGWRRMQLIKLLVAEIYVLGWSDRYTVVHECGNKNCVAPHHMLFTKEHHTQFTAAAAIKRKKRLLRDYRNEVLKEARDRGLTLVSEGDTNE